MTPRDSTTSDDAARPGRDRRHDVDRVQKRTLIVVVVSQALGGAGLAAGIVVGALLARDMLGTDSLAGLPTALFTLGSALTAFLVGRLTQRRGRRIGLCAGFGAGGIGAVGVVVAAVVDDPVLLFVSLFVYGAGTATNLQARYAGTDLARPERRGTAISVAMVATTFGAVAGPNLVDPLGQLAVRFGIPALAGPFLLAAVAYLAAAVVLFAFLRPDPFLVAVSLGDDGPGSADEDSAPSHPSGIYLGALIMVLTQITMVAIMTMTPVHMRAHDHSLAAVGLVIGLHIAAMWLPSPVTGVLVDVVGRFRMAAASGVTLLVAGLLAALAPGESLALLITALVLLGLGWNIGLIAGTALVVDGTTSENRPRTQGAIDVLVAVSGAGSGAASGVAMHAAGFSGLSVAGGVLALVLIPALIWTARRQA